MTTRQPVDLTSLIKKNYNNNVDATISNIVVEIVNQGANENNIMNGEALADKYCTALQASNSKKVCGTRQVNELNALVVKSCLPNVLSGLDSYLKYKRDVSNLAVPLELPKSTYRNQTIEFKSYFEKSDPKSLENNDISKFFNNNVEIAKNFKPLI